MKEQLVILQGLDKLDFAGLIEVCGRESFKGFSVALRVELERRLRECKADELRRVDVLSVDVENSGVQLLARHFQGDLVQLATLKFSVPLLGKLVGRYQDGSLESLVRIFQLFVAALG